MRVQTHALLLLLIAAVPVAHAQTKALYGTTAAQVQREVAAARSPELVNGGAGFQLICRGGPGLRFSSSGLRPAPAAYDLPSWAPITTLTMDFKRSSQSPDRSGRNLQPGQCSPAEFPLRNVDPTQLQSSLVFDGQWKQTRDGLPEDKSADVAERYPDARNIPAYLANPNHYWSFAAGDFGKGYLQAADSRYWKPEFYKGPTPSTTYQPAATAKNTALVGSSTTLTQATSRFGTIGTRTEGHAGTPAVPSPAAPAAPAPPPPVVPEPALPVVFSPPLLEDGAQLWACEDAAAGEANGGACSGEASAQAYCQLRNAEHAPDLVVAEAQPEIPVRAVNGDACQEQGACRVVSQLQCDR